jgi:hypothetical protein
MKYGSASAGMAAAAAVTSNGGGIYEQQSGVISGGGQAVMFAVSQQQQQQQMESQQQQQQQQQSSVIKTAPPGRNSAQMLIDFSPKQEPIDLAPLTSAHPCLQASFVSIEFALHFTYSIKNFTILSLILSFPVFNFLQLPTPS